MICVFVQIFFCGWIILFVCNPTEIICSTECIKPFYFLCAHKPNLHKISIELIFVHFQSFYVFFFFCCTRQKYLRLNRKKIVLIWHLSFNFKWICSTYRVFIVWHLNAFDCICVLLNKQKFLLGGILQKWSETTICGLVRYFLYFVFFFNNIFIFSVVLLFICFKGKQKKYFAGGGYVCQLFFKWRYDFSRLRMTTMPAHCRKYKHGELTTPRATKYYASIYILYRIQWT